MEAKTSVEAPLLEADVEGWWVKMAEVTILSIGSDSFSKSLLVDVSLSHTRMTICSKKAQYPDRSFCAPFLLLTKIDNQLREGVKKRFFLGNFSQMWVGGVADSQTRPNPLKTPPNHPENRLCRPEFHLLFSQISQKPLGGWVGKHIWERSPKKILFFWTPSLIPQNVNLFPLYDDAAFNL